MRLLLLMSLCLGLCLGALEIALPVSAAEQSPGVAYVDSSPANVSIDHGTGKLTVTVLNAGPDTTLTWQVVLAPVDGQAADAVVTPVQISLVSRSTSVIELTFSSVSRTGQLSGILVGNPTTGTPIARPLTISNFGLSLPISPLTVVLFALILSLLVVLLRYVRLPSGTYRGPLTNTKWDFTTSWASTFTGAGALLATLVSAGALPDSPYLMSKTDVAGLSVFFAAMGLAAPIVFLALNSATSGINIFLIATVLTATGVVGQLTTVIVLIIDAVGQASDSPVVLGLALLELVGVALTLLYVYRAIPVTLDAAKPGVNNAFPRPEPWALL
jgi:hypothetical protein